MGKPAQGFFMSALKDMDVKPENVSIHGYKKMPKFGEKEMLPNAAGHFVNWTFYT